MSRVELLQSLNAASINPFTATRADEQQRPCRFPVFLRLEGTRNGPISGLLNSPSELEARRLRRLRARGLPLRGILVVEYCAERHAEGLRAVHYHYHSTGGNVGSRRSMSKSQKLEDDPFARTCR